MIRFPEMWIRGEIKYYFSSFQRKKILPIDRPMLLSLRRVTANKQLKMDLDFGILLLRIALRWHVV